MAISAKLFVGGEIPAKQTPSLKSSAVRKSMVRSSSVDLPADGCSSRAVSAPEVLTAALAVAVTFPEDFAEGDERRTGDSSRFFFKVKVVFPYYYVSW